MLTSITSLLIACLAFTLVEIVSFRQAMTREMLSTADILGANSTAALEFDDPAAGEETLSALDADPRIVTAVIYTPEGQVFAAYAGSRSGIPVPPLPIHSPAQFLKDGYLHLFQPIMLGDDRIGTIYLQSDLHDLYARLQRYALIALAVLASALLVAFVLSSRLQRVISGPILGLVRTTRVVTEKRDYSARAEKTSDDEIGLLIDAFNEMLAQIQARDRTLLAARDELEERANDLHRELTERKRAEEALRETEEQLRQSQKMEAVGMLAGGIAHDFNNLLVPVSGYSELLMARLKDDETLRKYAEQIHKSSERAASLVGQLLAFSRKQVLQPQVLDLNSVVSDMNEMLRRLIGEDVDLATVLEPHMGRVKADPGQIEQVILNLVVNARDAMPGGGKLTIETANVVLDETYARKHMAVKPGPYVVMAVSDTGHGIDEKTQSLLFEPFFTTKDKSKGTGLGLSTVYGIIKQSGGSIWVYSEPGKGATFKVYLPRIDDPVVRSAGPEGAALQVRGSETVLVVEDEEDVRGLVCEVLRNEGYRILEAEDGERAIAISLEYPDTIHLMITDVVMPGMSGRETCDRITPGRPGMKVLYISGYTDNAIVHHGVLDPGTAFLQKPFTLRVLLQKVHAALNGMGQGPENSDPDSASRNGRPLEATAHASHPDAEQKGPPP